MGQLHMKTRRHHIIYIYQQKMCNIAVKSSPPENVGYWSGYAISHSKYKSYRVSILPGS